MSICRNNAFILAITATVACSCNNADGKGRVQGSLEIRSCDLEDSEFDLGVDFFTATYFENTLAIRLQRTGLDQLHADGIFIEIRDVEAVSENLGEVLEIEIVPPIDDFLENGPETGVGPVSGLPSTTHQSPARTTLFLNATCPDNTLGFADGDGTLVFDAIYQPSKGKRIKGTFDFRFIDPRTWESPKEIGDHAEIKGNFDFNYSHRQPEQPFI